tara:strand:+ start:902 stop:1201 length:300 start_codon:yes stop_codon:yes gene_type:complete
MRNKLHIGIALVAMVLMAFAISGLASAENTKVNRMIEVTKDSSIKYIQETCGFKKLQLEEAKFTDATPENVQVYKYLQNDEGCYYWFYTTVLKGELVKQ